MCWGEGGRGVPWCGGLVECVGVRGVEECLGVRGLVECVGVRGLRNVLL